MLTLKQIKAKITSVTPIAEKHGNQRSPACSIWFECNRSNLILSEFDPQLRNAFYQKGDDAKGQADLIVDEDLGGLTALRFPWFSQAIKKEHRLENYDVILHNGINEQSWINLDDTRIDDFSFQLKEGGSVIMKFRVFCHPTMQEQGRIDHMMQTETEISILPPQTAETLFDDKKAPKPSKARKQKDAHDEQAAALTQAFGAQDGGEAA